ncbi:hypothetical protein P43SY_005814 [Pythium insidiosum]|uniref:Copper transport protein n=1 Tax=Pythium insidiosum TaxID=114742 RepID=A0AAD5LR53_PYTIN|nr:hypothetical protein P43SY_005814 [Pythium insidiosum]
MTMASPSPSPPRRVAVTLLMALVLILAVDAKQNLKKTTCPLCDMDVRPEITAPILGNQAIYACEMAGHIDSLELKPKANLGAPVEANLANDVVYKDATEMKCPVCDKPFTELKYAVPWVALGNQKIFTCSKEHALEVFNNPTSYIGASAASGGFCNAGRKSVMFNGFQLGFGDRAWCALLLFQPWVLSSAVKYAFAFIGIVLLAAFMEWLGEFRDHLEKSFHRQHGIVYSSADYVAITTPVPGETQLLKSEAQPATNSVGVTMRRRIPLWCKLTLSVLYMTHLTIAYWLMLIIMMYEPLLFFAVVLGLAIGFFLFKETEGEKMSGNIDPCCST